MPRLIPIHRLGFETRLDPEEVHERLRVHVDPRPVFSLRPPPRVAAQGALVFRGTSAQGSFRLHRRITYRNGLLPIVHGRVTPVSGGSRVEVRMAAPSWLLAFLCLWMIGALAAAAFGLAGVLAGHPVGLVGLVFPLSGLGFVRFGFWPEAGRAERFLRRVLESDG